MPEISHVQRSESRHFDAIDAWVVSERLAKEFDVWRSSMGPCKAIGA